MTRRHRVVALMAAYNEGDIISSVLEHLVENGVEVYLLDNRSTDDTAEQAGKWLGRGLIRIETFPAPGEEARYAASVEAFSLSTILRREEELTREIDADWFLHHDADEIRESPFPGTTLAQGLEFVDAAGYNCVNFRVAAFPPVDDGFRQGLDPRSYFTRFEEGPATDRVQLKAWTSRGVRVSLAHSGGHEVRFEGRRVFPIPFLLRHYPIRGEAHGQRKVLRERRARYDELERSKSWHVQYDGLGGPDSSFLRDPGTLRVFDPASVRLDLLLGNRNAEELEKLLARARAALEHEELETSRLREALARLESAASTNGTQLREAELMAQSIELRRREIERHFVEMTKHRDALATRINDLERHLAEMSTHRDQVVTRVGDLERHLAEMSTHRDQLVARVGDLERHLAEMSTHRDQLVARVGGLERQIAALQAELDRVLTSRTWRWTRFFRRGR